MAERHIDDFENTMAMADFPVRQIQMMQGKARQDDDDTIDEAEKKAGEVGGAAKAAVVNQKVREDTDAAVAAKAKKDAEIADAQRRFNPWEGVYHNNDGTRTHFDGTPLNGVNEWIQVEGENMNHAAAKKHHHHHRHHFDNDYVMVRPTTLQEDVQKFTNGDYNSSLDKDQLSALQQESKQYQAAMAQKAAEAAKAKKAEVLVAKVTGTYNEFDGLYHGSDGSLFDANGNKITGVNIQLS